MFCLVGVCIFACLIFERVMLHMYVCLWFCLWCCVWFGVENCVSKCVLLFIVHVFYVIFCVHYMSNVYNFHTHAFVPVMRQNLETYRHASKSRVFSVCHSHAFCINIDLHPPLPTPLPPLPCPSPPPPLQPYPTNTTPSPPTPHSTMHGNECPPRSRPPHAPTLIPLTPQ